MARVTLFMSGANPNISGLVSVPGWIEWLLKEAGLETIETTSDNDPEVANFLLRQRTPPAFECS